MAMAHPLPSYGHRSILHRRRGSRSAPPARNPDIYTLREMLKPLNPDVTSNIRQSAKAGWQAENDTNSRSVTSYSAMHSAKRLDEPTQLRVRPESPNRMNKPHPENVFLATRLKKVPNYFDPDEAAKVKYGGSAKSRLNSYVEENRKQIENLRVKNAIQKRPQSALPDKQRVKMKTVFGDVEGQAVEAWTKLSSEKDKAALQQTIDEVYASKVGSRAASPAKSVTPQLRVSPKPASRKGSAASK